MNHDRLLLVPVVLGHLALFVLTVNIFHALGHSDRTMKRAVVVFLAVFASLSAVIGWEAWNGSIQAWSWPSLLYGSACLITGLVFFPAATAYLHHRPRPAGIEERESVVDFSATDGPHPLIGSGKHSWLLKLPGNQSFRLRKLECEVLCESLPKALDGLSVLHLSDLHLAPCFDRRYFEAVIEEAAAWPVDLALFTGDLVDHDAAIDWIEPLFSRLRGRLGSYAILGNHDVEHHPDRLVRKLENAGFTDLEGRWATIETGGARIALGGTSYPWGPPLPQADRPQADFRVLLSHAPDQFYWAEKAGFDLMLSGHNHGGQIRLPLVGAVFMPSLYSRRFDRGFFRKRGLTLHVSQGVAGKHPVRYGCLPEIGRLVLRAVPADRRSAGHEQTSRPHGHGASRSGETVH
jgi:uncharacterized protein